MGAWLEPALWGFFAPAVTAACLAGLLKSGAAAKQQIAWFVWGASVAFLALVVELYLWRMLQPFVVPAARHFVEAFVVAGLIEELCKVALIYSTVRQHNLLERGGIIAAGLMIGGGFAGAENVVYVLADHGVVFVRMMTAVPFHIANAVISAHFIHLAVMQDDRRDEWLSLSLLIAVLLHGVYDYLILIDRHQGGQFIFALALVVTVAVRLARAK